MDLQNENGKGRGSWNRGKQGLQHHTIETRRKISEIKIIQHLQRRLKGIVDEKKPDTHIPTEIKIPHRERFLCQKMSMYVTLCRMTKCELYPKCVPLNSST